RSMMSRLPGRRSTALGKPRHRIGASLRHVIRRPASTGRRSLQLASRKRRRAEAILDTAGGISLDRYQCASRWDAAWFHCVPRSRLGHRNAMSAPPKMPAASLAKWILVGLALFVAFALLREPDGGPVPIDVP